MSSLRPLLVMSACVALLMSCFRLGLDERIEGHDGGEDSSPDTGVDSSRDTSIDSDDDQVEGQWVELDGSASGQGILGYASTANNVRLASDDEGMPTILWSDDHTGNYEIYLTEWDGSAWRGLAGSDRDGGLSQSPGESRPGALDIDDEGRPWVTWMERGDGFSGIYFLRWDGVSWNEVGGSASGIGVSLGSNVWWPALVIDESGAPVIAWEVYNVAPMGSLIYLRRWDGLQWSELGGSATPPGVAAEGVNAYLVQLAVGRNSELHAVWLERATEDINLVGHRIFDGMEWTSLRGSDQPISPPDESTFGVHIVLLPDGSPVVCWQAYLEDGTGVRVMRWNGTGWTDLGDVTSGRDLSDPRHPNLAVDNDGRPLVVFVGTDALGSNVYLSAWNGDTWEPVDDADAEGGISASAHESHWPHIAWSSAGPIVVWEEFVEDDMKTLYLKAWR